MIDDAYIPQKKICLKCGASIDLKSKFCGVCGGRQNEESEKLFEKKWVLVKQAALFYVILISICAASNFIDYFQTLGWLLFIEGTMAIITVSFFLYNWADNKTILVWRKFSFQKLCAYGFIAVAASFFVHYSVGWLNVTIYNKQDEYYTFLKGNILGEFIFIFFIAVMPALFEELGFRGYMLQTLLKISDAEQALYISAFLFAILHMSFISLFWLIPFALLLGLVRLSENTLWYGVIMHFFFNLTACLFMLSGF